MEVFIRPVKLEDAVAINEMRRMDGVRENTLGLFSERITRSENFIKNLDENSHLMVAEVEKDGIKEVIGLCGLHIFPNPRLRHSASIGISIHKDYQGMGVGKKLMEKIIDLADNWLMLVRLELGVVCDNEKAIHLYKSMGFELEGTKKYAIIRNGEYVDEYVMGRYNKTSQN